MIEMSSDRAERIQVLIALGEQFRPVGPNVAEEPYPEANKVPACESEAYGWTWLEDGKLKLGYVILNPQGISAMAMARILESSLDGQDPEVVKSIPEDIVYRIFGRELSMGKSAGLMGMIQLLKRQVEALPRE